MRAAFKNVMPDEKAGAISEGLGIVVLGVVNPNSIPVWYSACDALPRVSIAELGAVCFDNDDLHARGDTCWIRGSWCTLTYDLSKHMLSIRQKIAGLKGIKYPVCKAPRTSVQALALLLGAIGGSGSSTMEMGSGAGSGGILLPEATAT